MDWHQTGDDRVNNQWWLSLFYAYSVTWFQYTGISYGLTRAQVRPTFNRTFGDRQIHLPKPREYSNGLVVVILSILRVNCLLIMCAYMVLLVSSWWENTWNTTAPLPISNKTFPAVQQWGGWGCEVFYFILFYFFCGGHHRQRGTTTTGSALDGAVLYFT